MKKLNKEQFVKKSRLVHGDKFNYDLVEYKNVRTFVKIICPNCGVFEQLPWTHMKGVGCLKCNLQTKDKFIEKSITKHGHKYNYENVVFINNTTKVKIKCEKHGIFNQTPALHIRGSGCPKCFNRLLQRENILLPRNPEETPSGEGWEVIIVLSWLLI